MSRTLSRHYGEGATTVTLNVFKDETTIRLLVQKGEQQMLVNLTVDECRQLSRGLIDLANGAAARAKEQK